MANNTEQEIQSLKETVASLKSVIESMQESSVHSLQNEMTTLKQTVQKMTETMGIEKVSLKDTGEKVMVQVDTTYGNISMPLTGGSSVSGPGTGMHSPFSNELQNRGSGTLQTMTSTMKTTTNVPAPGMTPEQLAEFKKQILQVNALQQKLKDVESKLSEASTVIKKESERTTELQEVETENTKDIYAAIDTLNNTLSEKIAQQRVEVQKIAGDQPQPINYDPFNYGEAYGGDLVDFQARKRILEIKLLLQGLQMTMTQMRDSMKVSPQFNLGYKVVRLDQLLGMTGFDAGVKDGSVTQDDALLVEQTKSRDPDTVIYPRAEAFETDPQHTSQWAITDSIMQTMYRLENELGQLQETVRTSDLTAANRAIEDLNWTLKQLKETSVDSNMVLTIVKESLKEFKHENPHRKSEPRAMQANQDRMDCSQNLDSIQQGLKMFQNNFEMLVEKVQSLEQTFASNPAHRESSAFTKTKGKKNSNCLSCDRTVNDQRGKSASPGGAMDGNSLIPKEKFPPRLRYRLDREYKVNVNNEIVDVFRMPRPCGAGYTQNWPPSSTKFFDNVAEKSHQSVLRFGGKDTHFQPCVDNFYIVGHDGRIYQGDKNILRDPKKKSMDPTNIPVAVMVKKELKTPPESEHHRDSSIPSIEIDECSAPHSPIESDPHIPASEEDPQPDDSNENAFGAIPRRMRKIA